MLYTYTIINLAQLQLLSKFFFALVLFLGEFCPYSANKSDYHHYLEKLTKNVLAHHKSGGLKNKNTLVGGSKCNLASLNLYQYKLVLNRPRGDMSQ